MRKLLVPLLVVVSLVVAGAAAGSASKTVTIAKTGYTPTAVSINTGDTVVFKNTDTVAHTVKLSPTTGTNCSSAVPLAIPAAGSASCTFASAGKFKFADAASNKKAFHGTITVASPLVSSIAVAPRTVVYGGKSTLSGKLASGQSGQSVQIHAQACGDTKSSLVATVTTTTGGAFTYQAQPAKKTAYTLSNKGLTAGTAVDVTPSLRLTKVKRHQYKLQISAAESFVGKVATFERYRSKLKKWVTVKRVPLTSSAAGSAPTVTTSAKFRSTITSRTRVRVTLGLKQVGACYLAGRSNTIHS
jgi:plastocyanin